MNEIEVKILSVDIPRITGLLETKSLQRVKNEKQVNTIYDFTDLRLKAEKGYARVRVTEDKDTGEKKTFITVKKMLSQEKYKEMEEAETEVLNEEEAHHILKALGLEERKKIIKDRISYKYKNSLIEMDDVDHKEYPFPLLEIETHHEDELKEIVSMLGYTMDDVTSKTMTEIVADKDKKDSEENTFVTM